ncbi:Uncharacterised protein [Shigella flexneri]|nr:Uncharacterised protein [Shigella flexneri]
MFPGNFILRTTCRTLNFSQLSLKIAFEIFQFSQFSVEGFHFSVQCRAHILSVAQGQCAIAPGHECFGLGTGESDITQDSFDFFLFGDFPAGQCVLDVADPRLVVRRERHQTDFPEVDFFQQKGFFAPVVFPVFQDVPNRKAG